MKRSHVTPWPLSLPLGDLSMVLGNYRCDARRESQGELPEFEAEFNYRALFQKMVTEFCICFAYVCMFLCFIQLSLYISRRLLPSGERQGSLTASNGQKLMPNLHPSCKFRLYINDLPWSFMIHINDYLITIEYDCAEVRTNTALQSPENPPRLDTLDPAANMSGRSQ